MKIKMPALGGDWLHLALLLLIFTVALLLRLWGIDAGLPYIYDPDEPIFVSNSMQMLSSLDLNPHWFGHPGATTLYSLLAIYLLLYGGGRLLGTLPSREAFVASYFADPSLAYLSGRLLSLAFGLGCILLTYWIARRLFDRWTALLAAAFVALSPPLVEYARLVRADLQLTFFLLAAFWFCLDIFQRGRWRDYLLAGGMTGLAIAAKYPGAFFVPILALAHFLRRPFAWRQQPKLVGAGLACLGALALASPFLFLEASEALAGLVSEARPLHLGATGNGLFDNLAWYLRQPVVESFTILGVIFLAVGGAYCLASRKKEQLLLVAFPLLFTILLSYLNLRWTRWLLPALPFLAIVVAVGVFGSAKTVERLARRQGWRGAQQAAWLALAISVPLLLLARADLAQGRELSGEDTRTTARGWILAHVPAGSRVLSEVYTPQLPREAYHYYRIQNGAVVPLELAAYPHADYRANFEWTDAAGKIENTRQICELGIDYVILSNTSERYLAEQERYPEIVATYQDIFALGRVVYEISPKPGLNPGPRLRVVRVENCP
jgi:4-amino-4-deoxy-L-arabinose transferase-like glycosyltransferase